MIDMNVLKQLGDLKKMQKQISRQITTIEERGVRVTVTGEQKIKDLDFDDNVSPKIVAGVINRAFDQLKKRLAKSLMMNR